LFALNQQKIDTIASFIDSTEIGIPKRNKVWLVKVVIDDRIPKAYVHWYSKEDNKWKLTLQKYIKSGTDINKMLEIGKKIRNG